MGPDGVQANFKWSTGDIWHVRRDCQVHQGTGLNPCASLQAAPDAGPKPQPFRIPWAAGQYRPIPVIRARSQSAARSSCWREVTLVDMFVD